MIFTIVVFLLSIIWMVSDIYVLIYADSFYLRDNILIVFVIVTLISIISFITMYIKLKRTIYYYYLQQIAEEKMAVQCDNKKFLQVICEDLKKYQYVFYKCYEDEIVLLENYTVDNERFIKTIRRDLKVRSTSLLIFLRGGIK